jgi:hypothetical protein
MKPCVGRKIGVRRHAFARTGKLGHVKAEAIVGGPIQHCGGLAIGPCPIE